MPNHRTSRQPPNRPAKFAYRHPGPAPTSPLLLLIATLPPRSRRPALNPTATLLSTARNHGSQIGKPEELMNWGAAGLKRGPYILRIAHPRTRAATYGGPCHPSRCSAESLPLTSLTSQSFRPAYSTLLRSKDPQISAIPLPTRRAHS